MRPFPLARCMSSFSFSPSQNTGSFPRLPIHPRVRPSTNQPRPSTQLSTNGTSYWLSKDHPYTGKAAFEVYQAKAPDTAVGLGQAALRQWFYITQGFVDTLSHQAQSLFSFAFSSSSVCDVHGLANQRHLFVHHRTAYKLTFYTYQTETPTNFIGVKINGQGLGTIDPNDNNGVGKWVFNEFDFTAATGGTELEFEFFTGTGSVQRIDDIVLTPGK